MPYRYWLVALAVLVSTSTAFAQNDAAVAAVKQHFVSNQARYGVSAQDLAELVVTDVYEGRRAGATYVYLKQAYNGLEIVNASANAAVDAQGHVVAPNESFVADVAERVNTTEAAISAAGGADAAIRHLVRTIRRPDAPVVLADSPGEIVTGPNTPYPSSDFTANLDNARLVYFAIEGRAINLAWAIEVDSRFGHMWLIYVDAQDGRVIHTVSLTNSDTWGSGPAQAGAPINLAPIQHQAISLASAAASGSYNVFALPAESPNHGPQTTVVNPHDPASSPLGWHDTGTNAYTITRGNNTFAYEDRDANNAPGFSPDGGAPLVFDFPFDELEQPVDYQDLAVTNLFYWNNIVHDVMYQYGFDEASGNFQVNNFGNGGAGNDAVLAEAQDGSGTDNANFSTPGDGGSGRMQMFEWSPGGSSFTIDAPPEIAGPYAHGLQVPGTAPVSPDWGDTDGFDLTGDLVLVQDKQGEALGCVAPENAGEIAGNIALIERGGCPFLHKVYYAQEAGAVAAVIHNCDVMDTATCTGANPGEVILGMTADPAEPFFDLTVIPAMFVVQSVGEAMRDNLPGVTVSMEESLGTIFRDSDLDSGIIAHEYGHGISNRLTGGPNNVGCLGNLEQMGEGWSDFFGLILTQQPGDTATEGRGVGTYVEFEPADGIGIRPTPYSTDFGINSATYGDTVSLIAGQQHTVGYIWASALWELTWDLIAANGYDPDIYNAAGTAGNQIALQLVMEGLRLQPCSPGFVDGRDAILEADQMLYSGANTQVLWEAFARRGLGQFADQGSSNLNSDNVEDFVVPVANESGLDLPVSHTLSQAYPNPFNPQAQFTLSVGQAQNVRVEVFDVLGRQVALLHDGQLASGVAHQFTIDGSGLASGIYTYRVVGEHFTSSKRVTLLK